MDGNEDREYEAKIKLVVPDSWTKADISKKLNERVWGLLNAEVVSVRKKRKPKEAKPELAGVVNDG